MRSATRGMGSLRIRAQRITHRSLLIALLALVPFCAAGRQAPVERDPFQPVPAAQPAPAPGDRAAGPARAVKGKVGAGGRWLFWTIDGQGRWRRFHPSGREGGNDRADYNDITRQKDEGL